MTHDKSRAGRRSAMITTLSMASQNGQYLFCLMAVLRDVNVVNTVEETLKCSTRSRLNLTP